MLGKTEGKRRRRQQRIRWLASLAQRTWIWAQSRRQWRTEEPGLLQSMGSQRVRHDVVIEQQQQRNGDYNSECVCVSHSVMSDTSWPMDCQAPLSVEFSRKEYWSGLPSPFSGDVPDPGLEPRSPALQADSLPSEPPGKLVSHIKKKAVLLETGSLENGASWIFQRWHLNVSRPAH